MVISENPWYSRLLSSVWQWSCVLDFCLSRRGFVHPIFCMRVERSTSFFTTVFCTMIQFKQIFIRSIFSLWHQNQWPHGQCMQFDYSTLEYINFYNFSPISEVQKGRRRGLQWKKGRCKEGRSNHSNYSPPHFSLERGGGGMITLVPYHHQKFKIHSYTFNSTSEPSSSGKSVPYFCGFWLLWYSASRWPTL